MAPFGIGDRPRGRDGIRQSGTDAVQLVIDYVKQETLTPLRGLGRYLVFGIVGSLALCIGLVLLLVALLRALQTETGTTFSGNLTWLPYLIVCAAAVLLGGLSGWRVTKGSGQRRRPAPTSRAAAGSAVGSVAGSTDGHAGRHA